MGIRRADGRVSDAQLHRRPDERELLGHASRAPSPITSRRDDASRMRSPTIRTSTASIALTHGARLRHRHARAKGIAILRAHARRLCGASELPPVLFVGLGLRDEPDLRRCSSRRGLSRTASACRQLHRSRTPAARSKTIPSAASRWCSEMLADAQPRHARAGAGVASGRSGLQCGGSDGYSGISRQPGARRRGRPARCAHGGTAILSETPGGLRRGASADAPRGEPRGRREAARAHRVVGGLLRAQRRRARQQSVGRQQGRAASRRSSKSRSARWPRAARRISSTCTSTREPRRRERASSSWIRRATTRCPRRARWPAGANLICFTTGRGSAYGCAPSPSLKLATNTALWQRQEDDMDINCGGVIDGQRDIDRGTGRGDLPDDAGLRVRHAHEESELHGYGQNW